MADDCAACGGDSTDSPLADLCRDCVTELCAGDPAKPLDVGTRIHLNYGGGKGRWVTIGDLLAAPTEEPTSE